MTSPEPLHERLHKLEAAADIRKVMARYMALCDHLDENTPLAELGALFTENATWSGRGARYAAAFGAHQGRAAIMAMLATYCTKPPHFVLNAHFLTNETIDVNGNSAQGTWMMLQTSTTADGKSDLRSARLEIGFAREDGLWRIARFATENVFARLVSTWNDGSAVPTPQHPGG